jgi:hypothetical protein
MQKNNEFDKTYLMLSKVLELSAGDEPLGPSTGDE